jgi:two-component system, response regulator PdtaR
MNDRDPPTPQKHLLLVDDDRLVLAMVARGLIDAGYRVSSADSAEEAEAMLADGTRPDLVILDVRMPGNSGLYLAQRLLDKHIPFMLLSAYSASQIVVEAAQCGALAYAVKPLEVAQLIPAIEVALVRAKELQSLRTTGEQLQTALDQERAVSVAVGITMMQYRLARRDAFDLLRSTARRNNTRLAALAAEIVRTCESIHD